MIKEMLNLIWLKLWKCTTGKRISVMGLSDQLTFGCDQKSPATDSQMPPTVKTASRTSTMIQYTRLQQFASRPNTCLR